MAWETWVDIMESRKEAEGQCSVFMEKNPGCCDSGEMSITMSNIFEATAKRREEKEKMPVKSNSHMYDAVNAQRGFVGKPQTFSVKKVENFNNRAVKVTFSDGSFTTARCTKNDTFDLDTGITICLIKRMMQSSPTAKDGTKNYNKVMKAIHKMMDRAEKDKKKQAEEEAARRRKQKDILAKKEAKRLAKREEQIEIQKEAYLRAMAERERGCMVKEDDLK